MEESDKENKQCCHYCENLGVMRKISREVDTLICMAPVFCGNNKFVYETTSNGECELFTPKK